MNFKRKDNYIPILGKVNSDVEFLNKLHFEEGYTWLPNQDQIRPTPLLKQVSCLIERNCILQEKSKKDKIN